jgi:UDP-3-O-[3-hydroxymyristoyl] glucosamine N-acyltransferase
MKLAELVERLGGNLVQGNPDLDLAGVDAPETAKALDLVFAEDSPAAEQALQCEAGAIVLKPGCAESLTTSEGWAIVEAPNPRLWFARAAQLMKVTELPAGVHPAAVIGPNVEIGENVTIAAGAIVDQAASVGRGTKIEAGAVIGRSVQIGENCHIYPRAVLYPGVTLGDRVVVHAGAVLGADGFGYVRDNATGAYTQFPQQGTLFIEDDVEIGANSTIDRGALQETRIRRGTKIDNLVHIGHNCDIGEDVIIVAGTGISGSCTVGKSAVIAGQVGIGDHAHIGPGVILGGQAGVLSGKTVTNEGLKPGTVLWGTPARPLKQVLRELALVARLAKKQRTESKD